MKIEFSSQRREMLLFLTLTDHQLGRHDVTSEPAITLREGSIEQILVYLKGVLITFHFVLFWGWGLG